MSLVDTKLRNLDGKKQEPKTLSHRDSLNVSKRDIITWQYRCRFEGKQMVVSLGRYPRLSIFDAKDYILKFQQWLKEKKLCIELKLPNCGFRLKNPKLRWQQNIVLKYYFSQGGGN